MHIIIRKPILLHLRPGYTHEEYAEIERAIYHTMHPDYWQIYIDDTLEEGQEPYIEYPTFDEMRARRING